MVLPLEYPATTPNLIRRAAERFGDRDFVLTPRQRITFGEAEQASRRLAKRLLAAGIGKGTRVGILFPQGPDFVVALLAIARIGALCVPLSTFLRGPELRRAIRHVDVDTLIAPRLLLGQDTADLLEAACPQLRTATGPVLLSSDVPYLRNVWLAGGDERPWVTDLPELMDLDEDGPITEELLAEVEAEVSPADDMVIIYTSGATAEPKGVVHTHGAQVGHGWTLAQLYGLGDDVRTFTNMPFFWVGGLTVTLLTHLHVGGAVITVERMDTLEMLDLIEATRPTRLLGFTLHERLMADPTFAARDLSWIADLATRELQEAGLRHKSLGMSETCGPHTVAPVADTLVDLADHLRGSFGPPAPGLQHQIVDPVTHAVLPDGIDGEICVRGDSLMEGLYKKQRRETFDADGWYHTGDKGCFREGLLFFKGRLTEMIKTGGANVAPREVELALESLPGVKAAFVVGVPDAERGELVGSLVCPEPGCDLDAAALVEQLGEQLSSFKIPRRIIMLPYDDAPWLPSGKISKPRIVDLLRGDG